MSAAVVQRRFGGPEVLELTDVPTPTAADLRPDEVLVRVAYAGVNVIDAMTRTGGGMAAAGAVTLPYTPGSDVAGTVEAVGSDVVDLTASQRVFGLIRFPAAGGTYAQHTVAPADHLIATPDTLTDEQAGALPLTGMTAWQALADTTTVQPGQRVLISGAAGGVGHLAVQIAHHLGATVIAIDAATKLDRLRELGADVTVDFRDAAAMTALEADPADVTLSLAPGSKDFAVRATRRGGVLVGLGGGADTVADAAAAAGVRLALTHVRTERAWLEAIAGLAAQGHLVPAVDEVFDLADVAEAHRALESGRVEGKIVLRA
ncbi:NADP-dependent oxidoreductase [Flexivirga oryzae]|uniref:NADPH:quinone reductase-like Zn-dependent oxidoreductase n=1 Tax=Flexivirga oryzae TaxID=1794944 RepID=A0A839NH50_9MICO|nr:NADP-dependent oxidoreductase [Flexivirga oryzae]MBB2893752.1 NADPH:quinone reductase-like Zn-dependent oxidoreductase [Flexivirga oryzae]